MTLLENINRQTQGFKKDFLTKYRESVTEEFNNILSKYTWNGAMEEVALEMGIDPKKIYHTRGAYLKGVLIQDIHRDNKYGRLDARIEKEVATAEKGYEAKQMKLADRLGRHLNDNNDFKVRVYSNYPELQGVVEVDGIDILTFYIIVAEGPIQRPHYRYLVR